jgi:hypothetical protein
MRRTVEPPDARCLLLENETCTVVARTRLDAGCTEANRDDPGCKQHGGE